MNLCDPYVWLAMVLPTHKHHKAARAWWDGLTSEKGLFCRSSQQAFLDLLTTVEVLKPYGLPARTPPQAWKIYQQLMSDPCAGFLQEPEGLEELWMSLSSQEKASPKLWMNAYLSTLAIKSGSVLITFDKAFQEFEREGLRVKYLGPS